MKETPQKVVVLNNFTSPYIKEAIIVLKDYNPKLDSKAIADAEMIVARYIDRQKNRRPRRNTRFVKGLVKFIIGSLIISALVAAFIYLR